MSRPAKQSQSQQGIALVSVLAVTVVTVILAAIFSYMVLSERRSTNAATVSSDSLQLADAATERARAKIIATYEESFLSSDKFVEKLNDTSDELAIELGAKNPVAVTVGEGGAARWRYEVAEAPSTASNNDRADFRTGTQWLDIYASAETGQGVQTVIRRINMGQSDVFTFAMLSENTDCMYCHLRVYGDVGSLGFFRPGHPGVGSAGKQEEVKSGGSVVNGDLYVASDPNDPTATNITTDQTNLTGEPKEINGGIFDGDVFTQYKGSRFPTDGEGNVEFPPITRNTAINSADGTITGGTRIDRYGADGSKIDNGVSNDNDGNVVLVGTEENPIVLNEDVYFSGDVVIKGYVQGKGGIYAGRNVYVAGDIKYKNPPRDCRSEDNPDQCAQEVITDDKYEADELRIAARGNVVLGDYTETTGEVTDAAKGTGEDAKSWQGLNAADYFRDQFGFREVDADGNSNLPFRYDKRNGDELTEVSPDVFENADGDVIEDQHLSDPILPEEAYSYSMRPGSVSGNNFTSWLSDKQYQDILGTQVRAFDTWRKNVDREELRNTFVNSDEATALESLRALLGPGAESLSDESLKKIACVDTPCETNFDLMSKPDPENDIESLSIGRVNWNAAGTTIRVILDEPASYEAQVNRVDAFLYSNQRIAGKTFNAPLAINGGMISRELGVLAPGAQKQKWQDSERYDFLDLLEKDCNNLGVNDNIVAKLRGLDKGAAPDKTQDGYYDLGYSEGFGYVDDCALTVNYDYRMRNGGLGFNLVAQDVGRTVSWRVGSNASDRVAPPQ